MTDAQENAPAPPDENNNVAPKEWCVYAISAEGEEEDPFYIGITSDFRQRVSTHNTSPSSAAYDRQKAYEALGRDCLMTILARYPTEQQARAYETAMIAMHPRLVNRTVYACALAFLADFHETVSADG